jgi:hypothetical protein
MNWSSLRTACLVALAGCVKPPPQQADVPLATQGARPLPAAKTDGEAERLVVGAASCWLGGIWSDAVGETNRPAANGRRCEAVLVHVYGTADPLRYRQLRAVEPIVVEDIAARVKGIAGQDLADAERAGQLVALLRGVADAERENVLARVAADDVKQDEAHALSTAAERATDKTIAASALRRTSGIERLLALDAGEFTHEAHAIGLLCALDRLEIARKLPKHLKVYAVGGPFVPIFGVQPPAVPEDPTSPIRTGTWPGYLVDLAGATGHAVPVQATEPIDRESLAWGGVLQGFADRLHAEAAAVSPRTNLPIVLDSVANRLDRQNRTLRALFDAEHARR